MLYVIDMPNGDVIEYNAQDVDQLAMQLKQPINEILRLLKKTYMDSCPNQEDLFQ